MEPNGGKSGIRGKILRTVSFVIKFVVIMSLLYLSAVIFAYLEDPELDSITRCVKEKGSVYAKNNSANSLAFNSSNTILWKLLEEQQNITLTQCDREAVMETLANLVVKMKESRMTHLLEHENDNHFEVQKWFYFVIIATTTIGYGDVSPKTQQGKLFYIGFSVIGIILMMYLLKNCGDVISGINKYINGTIGRLLCPGTKCWDDKTLTMITNTAMFLFYLSLGIWHDVTDRGDKHSIVDIVYFWITSFTTVGFGDIGHPLSYEIEHAYLLTIYRLFGLSMLTAVINSIMSYIGARKKSLRNRTLEHHKKLVEMIISLIKPSEPQKYLLDSNGNSIAVKIDNSIVEQRDIDNIESHHDKVIALSKV